LESKYKTQRMSTLEQAITEDFKHRGMCVLNELKSALELCARLGRNPEPVIDPYLQLLINLCRDEAARIAMDEMTAENQRLGLYETSAAKGSDHIGEVNKMVASSLVERVQEAIHDVEFPHGNDEACAAIREVAAWLVDQHIDSDGCIQSDVGCVISRLREEAGPTLSQED
jgi:hypothetical protein